MTGSSAFDRYADLYEAWFRKHPFAYESELRALRALLPSAGRGIEIGVGTGRFAAPLGITYGVEPSRPMAELARKRGIEVTAGVAEQLPCIDGEFDFALMVATLCFLANPEAAFREVRRVLRAGGSFLIGFVDGESFLGRKYARRKEQSVFYREATFYSVRQVTDLLERTGFENFEYRQTLFKPPSELTEAEAVQEGFGRGSFVALRAGRGY